MLHRFSTPGKRVAAFDLDHTLIKPRGKRKFAQSKEDAEYVFPNIPQKLQELRDQGYKLVVFTNQKKGKKLNYMGRRIPLQDTIFYKVDKWLGKDVDIFIATENDFCRKPLPGMHDAFWKLNGEIQEMFYVGDAAGREGDFSNSDRLFAYNTEMKFCTPEQFFLGTDNELPGILPLLSPVSLPAPIDRIPDNCMVLMVGFPACGKSTLVREIIALKGGTICSNDITKNVKRTQKLARQTITEQKGVVIVDNTHPSDTSRAPFIKIAQESEYPVICIYNRLPEAYCQHLNKIRAYQSKDRCIPDVAYHVFRKKFVRPSVEEGFAEIWEYVPALPKSVFRYRFI
jgi:bifunctional polynucleotide phosphatase/kinase